MIKKVFLLSLILMTTANTASCANAVRVDGPYEGRVIDAETGQPIEGVVVLGVWNKEMPSVAGAVSSYHDATETLTDANGDFKIQGQGTLIASNILPVQVVIYKSGYEYVSGSWQSLKVGYLYSKKVKWEKEKAIIPLKKLTLEERKIQGTPDYPSGAPERNKRLILKEINKDRAERGLNPVN